MRGLLIQMTKFGLVGLVATAVHYCVAIALMATDLPPFLANAVAFLLAFRMSFLGHFRWSFRSDELPRRVALRRFFAVAVAGFIFNECLFAVLLGWTVLLPEIALLVVLVAVAASTFVLSKFWAFAIRRDASEQTLELDRPEAANPGFR